MVGYDPLTEFAYVYRRYRADGGEDPVFPNWYSGPPPLEWTDEKAAMVQALRSEHILSRLPRLFRLCVHYGAPDVGKAIEATGTRPNPRYDPSEPPWTTGRM